jgi:hypothetical protein
LQLQQLHHLGGLAGRGDRPQLAAGVAEHDPGRVRGQQLDAEPDQPVQQVDDVVVVDQGVGQRDERPADPLLTTALGLAHRGTSSSGPTDFTPRPR